MILHADARSLPLRDASAQCVVTSPPYWGLRDYGTATWDGGDAACDHRSSGERRQIPHGDGRINDSYADERHLIAGAGANFREACGKCGAKRIDRQLGLEPTPDAYVASMVEVFREVWRVLRNDGVLWLNLGSSYAGGEQGRDDGHRRNQWGAFADGEARPEHMAGTGKNRLPPPGFKPKDLVPIPWMVAMALQSDGWWLRQDIIWSKSNPMPESVIDRCTKAHEYLFLLTKSARYYWDAEAMQEPAIGDAPGNVMHKGKTAYESGAMEHRTKVGLTAVGARATRNRRSVWTIATKPYAGAHFATMPPDLVKPCILASTRPGDIVFDPFLGSGTVAEVAWTLGRKGIGTELNPAYHTLAKDRTTVTMGLPLEASLDGTQIDR